uniref:DsbA thioredoxin domain protein n=1 Tax=uncultured organism TaxID=155900 RepID=D8VN41_9ZZZZ|nr:DsbA thioredoxin domain protein [uncultured organism]
MNKQLHYINDPLCGWCYAAAPLISAAAEIPQFNIQLHCGGLWINEHRRPLGKALRDYVKPLDERIQLLTGQPFGERYFNGLLLDNSRVLDSEPLIHAMLAVEKAGGSALTMLQRIQQTHYRDGIWTGSVAVLAELAAEQSISTEQFIRAKEQVNVVAHMAATQKLMARLGVSGYPSIVLQMDDSWQVIALNSFLGKRDAFKAQLEKTMSN